MEVQESQQPTHVPDFELTEEALVMMREQRRAVAEQALQLQGRHEANRDAAQQAANRLGGVHAAINTQAKALREKLDQERAETLDSAVEALAEGKEFGFSGVSSPALKAELEGLMLVLSDVAERRMPATRRALAAAEIEVLESQGAAMLRVADFRSAEALRLGIEAAKFEGGRNISSALPDDGKTASLRREGRGLIEQADARRRALDRQ